MGLRAVRAPSGSGGSPGVFRDDSGNLVVRGYVVDDGASGVAVKPGEALVAVPVELLVGLSVDEVSNA